MEISAEPSSNGYVMVLMALGSVLGLLTVRVRHQQKLEERTAGGEIVVTSDFKSFQALFMSECPLCIVFVGSVFRGVARWLVVLGCCWPLSVLLFLFRAVLSVS